MGARLLAAVSLVAVATSAPAADACTIMGDPSATVFAPASGAAPGHRPWIVLWNVTGAVRVTSVVATCAKDKVCPGKEVAVDRSGNYLRPRANLPAGAHLQVTSGKRVLADVTISSEPEGELPAWDGVELVSAKDEPEGLCEPSGPVVRVKLKPTKAVLDGTVVLIYLSKPNAKRPQGKLARIISLGASGSEISMMNSLGQARWMKKVPTELWIMLADGDGHTGPAVRVI